MYMCEHVIEDGRWLVGAVTVIFYTLELNRPTPSFKVESDSLHAAMPDWYSNPAPVHNALTTRQTDEPGWIMGVTFTAFLERYVFSSAYLG